MPQVVPSLLYAAGYVSAAYAAGAAIVVYGAYKGRQQRKDANRAYQTALSDRKVMIRSADSPRAVVYGQQRISGPIIYARGPKSDDDPYVWIVIALAAKHKLHAIDEIYFGDTPIGPINAFGDVTGGAFARVVTESATQQGVVPSNNVVSLSARPGTREPIQLQTVVAAVTSSQAQNIAIGDDPGTDVTEVPVGILDRKSVV